MTDSTIFTSRRKTATNRGKIRRLPAGWLLLGLLIPFLFLFSCGSEDEGAPQLIKQATPTPDQESWKSQVVITDNGRRVAEIWAGYIAVFNQENRTLLRDSIHVDFYNSLGKHKSVLTADEGIVFNTTNDLLAKGHVVVTSDSGVVLKTTELTWKHKIQKIISKVPVVFTTATDTLMGDSFVSDADLRNYEIKNARGYSHRDFKLPQ